MRRFVLLGAVLAVLVGCTPEPHSATWTGGVDTLPSGTIVVHNPARGSWDSASAWRMVEDLRIGPSEDGPEAFSSITVLAVDAGGRIYVLDRQAQEVRVFAPDGHHLRTIGRKGGGPGEFSQADGIVVDEAGRLWVGDRRARRFSVFDTSGTLIADYHRQAPPGSFANMVSGGASGALWDAWRVSDTPDGQAHTELLHFVDGEYQETVRFPPFEQRYWQVTTHEGMSTNTFRFPVPFTARELITPAPADAVWRAVSGEYRLTRFSAGGDSTRIVLREYEPVPVTPEDRERVLPRYRKTFAGSNTRLDESLVPEHQPALHGFVVDDRGYLWVAPVTGDTTRLPFDVFDPEGRYLGAVETAMTPRMLNPQPVVRGGHLYCVGRDELDVPYVVRLRIVGQ